MGGHSGGEVASVTALEPIARLDGRVFGSPEEAAEALIGRALDDAALGDLAAACSKAATPMDDKRGTVDFRRHVSGVLARRAAGIAAKRAKGETA
jgi:xanthine dehydrogenase iron-sulfur cluster and FAD-binding subunit A